MSIATHSSKGLNRALPGSALVRLWRDALQKLRLYRETRKQQRIDRAAFETLLYLDDATLADIGYDRADVLSASRLPVHVNAARTLNRTRDPSGRREIRRRKTVQTSRGLCQDR